MTTRPTLTLRQDDRGNWIAYFPPDDLLCQIMGTNTVPIPWTEHADIWAMVRSITQAYPEYNVVAKT